MADVDLHSDDISGLWKSERDDVLTPVIPATTAGDPESVVPAPVTNGNGNGSRNGNANTTRLTRVEEETRDEVARLAQAIADSRADVIRPADLQAARAEMEGAFTQQLAVALYELMAATNARFATAEDHINQRVSEAVEVHTTRLAAALDGHQQAAREMMAAIWTELQLLREQHGGLIDGLAAFRREMRREVGRLSDMVTAQARESAQQSAVEREQRERHDDWVVKAASDVIGASGTLAAISEDLALLRSEVAELRAVVNPSRQKDRKRSRWGRSR